MNNFDLNQLLVNGLLNTAGQNQPGQGNNSSSGHYRGRGGYRGSRGGFRGRGRGHYQNNYNGHGNN